MSLHLPRIGLPLCVLSAGVLALTDESSAQVVPQRNSRTLSADMAEAGRGPFHARDPVNRSMGARPGPEGDPAAPSRRGNPEPGVPAAGEYPRAASNRAPSTASLVLLTGLGAVLGDVLVSRVVEFESENGPVIHGILSAPLTALAATGAGARPGWALFGASLGFPTGIGAAILVAYALEDALGMAALLPAIAAHYCVRVAVVVATVKLAGT
ncbi:MAG: hypothetical protein OXQ94_09525 [Gemmatimonadota bacterium]|nr:hypothetical protein [Gemmatimonadota bacterium]MDE2871909.1 hypothetical protein [Gemmatimonadota bacterium]